MNYSGDIGAGRIYRRLDSEDGGGRADILLRVLHVVLPHKKTIATMCVVATALAGIGLTLSGPSYTSTAIVEPQFRGSASAGQEKGTGMQPLDPSVLLVGQIQFIRSQPLPRAIAEHLFGEGSKAIPAPGMLGSAVRWLLGSKPASAAEVAHGQLRSRLAVSYIPRSYLIQVSYTAPTREGAAAVANAVSGEFVRSEHRKRLLERAAAAAGALASLSTTYGDRHPHMVRAKADLEAAQASLSEDTEATAPMSEQELAATGTVVPAQAHQALVDRGLRTVLFGLVMGLLIGLGWVVFRERERLRQIVSA